ncbi:metallophosphoesterase [Staphylococcus arlettae]|uniref:purple acid phosphatase family protein n=1 Tax=Staphylococcus TaxID=1279 RepID=UPI00194EF772|nr:MULTISPECIES: metallophosphoesterase family protein [unclassified Staphylococcus]
MKRSTSSIIFTLSVSGFFVGTHNASASELAEQQQQRLEVSTNDKSQNDNMAARSSEHKTETRATNLADDKLKDDTNSQDNKHTYDNVTSDDNSNTQENQVSEPKAKQPENSDKKLQSSNNDPQTEDYTAEKAQAQLPSQATSNQHNPGNKQQRESKDHNTTEAMSKQQPKEKQLEQTAPKDTNNQTNQLLTADDTATMDSKEKQQYTDQGRQNHTDRATEEQHTTTADQTQANEHRYGIMTIGKDDTERNLTWYHESDEQGYVEVAEANERGDFSNAKRIEGDTHKGSNTQRLLNKDVPDMNYTQATIPNLEENKEYMYRFYNGADGEKSAIRRFDTNNNGETNFIAVADPQLGASGDLAADNAGWQNTVNQMVQLNKDPDFLMSLGDQVNKPWDEQAYSGFIEAKGMENFTVVPTLGNHDRANKAYSQHFNLPNLQDGGKNLASSNFYFTHNDTLFVSLNSESLDFKGHEETMKRAIEDTKAQNPKWIVGLTHRNPYSAGKHSDTLATKIRRDKFAPLMEKYNVDLVLGGHDHSYSRSHVMNGKDAQVEWDENGEAPQTYNNPDGTIYVTLNSASGSKFYELDGEKDYAAKSIQDNQPAYTKVNITKDYIELVTYHVPQGSDKLGEPIDRVRINKDDN